MNKRRVLFLGFALLACGGWNDLSRMDSCGGTTTTSSADLMPADIDWEVRRTLTWNDYQAPVPSPQPTFTNGSGTASPELSETVSGMSMTSWTCNNGKIDVTVSAIMSPSTSWAATGGRTAALLAHEQGHFDLSEIYARKLRAQLAAIMCENTTSAQAAVDAAFNMIDMQLQTQQSSYDNETAHGTNAAAQATWQMSIQQQLATP